MSGTPTFIAAVLLLESVSCSLSTEKSDLSEKCSHERTAAADSAVPHSQAGALLATRFTSLEDLESLVWIQYFKGSTRSDSADHANTRVRLSLCSNGRLVVSELKAGVSEADFTRAQEGGLFDRLWLSIRSPYTLKNRRELRKVSLLARRNNTLFGAGDVAFYDLAEASVDNIGRWDSVLIHQEDLTEKGYLNTFNHITAQALMTTLFSEDIADFMADAHERHNMPELITGKFTPEQLADSINNPVDNYVDMLNNEWGQELGNRLRDKYDITRQTVWTPGLLTDYLNDLQKYYTWTLQIGFQPFRPEDEVVTAFSKKINRVFGMYPD